MQFLDPKIIEMLDAQAEEATARVSLQQARDEGRAEGKEEGRTEGKEEGRKEGKEEGRKEEKLEMAQKLLDVLDIETIAIKTGLSIEQIKKLKQ